MRIASSVVVLAAAFLPVFASAQSSSAPVSDAFREELGRFEKYLVASAQEMPADKYGFKPTPAQMTVGEVVLHIARDNDDACPGIGGLRAPERTTLTPTDDKDKLVARLRETFALCDQVAAHLDDSKLGEQVSGFGYTWTRAALMDERMEDWVDHYSQLAIYLRLNGLLPPTAQPHS